MQQQVLIIQSMQKTFILAMTADKDNLLKISKDYSDFTNTKSGMAEAATDDANFSSEFLGGQNPFAYLHLLQRTLRLHRFLHMIRDV